ncbi:MAG: hypothetical protein JWP65_597 [Ramlibacter sp.]|nr:hypothetical protein [Ramlibacter sp.]
MSSAPEKATWVAVRCICCWVRYDARVPVQVRQLPKPHAGEVKFRFERYATTVSAASAIASQHIR